MLDPDYLLRVSEGAEAIADELHQTIIKQIIRRIMVRMVRGDSYILTATDKWQLETLQEAGLLLEDIRAEIAKYTSLQTAELQAAFEEAGVKTLVYDHAIYEAAGLSPAALEQSPHLIRLLQRNYEKTLGEWRNFTGTYAQAAQKTFIQEVDKAYNLVSTGAMSYTQAVAEAVERISEDGVTVTYVNADTGRTRRETVETATMRAVRTGISQAAADITNARMDEMGWDVLLVSAHLGARYGDGGKNLTNHFWWQGKFYSKSGKDSRFLPFLECGQGHVQGINGANCRHSYGPGDGVHNPYEGFDSEENKRRYDLEQRQRTLERRIRHIKRELMGLKEGIDNAPDGETRDILQKQYDRKAALLLKRNKEYNTFCEGNGLKRKQERLFIAKWDREQAREAVVAAKRGQTAKADAPKAGSNGKKQSDSKEPYTDITGKWYPDAKPNGNEVQDLSSYTVDGVTYQVDGNYVKLEYSPHEKEIAELLEREVGGEMYMVPKVNYPKGVRTPDYIFNGNAYDLKTLKEGASDNTIFNRVKKSKGQTKRVIVETTKSGLNEVIIDKQIKKIFSHPDTRWIEELVIIHGEKIAKVLKRK